MCNNDCDKNSFKTIVSSDKGSAKSAIHVELAQLSYILQQFSKIGGRV